MHQKMFPEGWIWNGSACLDAFRYQTWPLPLLCIQSPNGEFLTESPVI